MQAVVYVRVSTEDQVHGTSLDSQMKACREHASKLGYELPDENIFREEGVSAKLINRPELAKLLTYCAKNKGKIGACIVWKVDRLARNSEYHHIIKAQLIKVGVKLVSVTEPIDDTPMGNLMDSMLAAFAQFDNDIRLARTTGGMKARTEQGGWPHDAPYGYSKYRTPSGASSIKPNDDAPIAKRFLEEFSTGAYTVEQAADLSNKMGIRSRNGKPRTWQTVKNMLTSPLYMGSVKSKYTDGETLKGLHEAIISERIFYKNQSILSGNTKNHSKQAEDAWPLRGGFLKHTCGKPMTGSAPRGKGGPSPRYSCMTCRKSKIGSPVSKMRVPLHDEFMDLLGDVRPSKKMQELFKTITLRQWNEESKDAIAVSQKLGKEVDSLKERKSKIIDMFIADQLTEEQKNEKLQNTDIQINELRLRMVEADEYVEEKESVIDGALMFMSDPASFWNISGIELKKRVQDAIFPEGLVYDCADGFRTPVLSESYLLIKEIALAGDQNPNVVPGARIELATSGL